MIWAQWVIGGVGAVGALLLIPLGIRLWRQVKALGSTLAAASTTFADAAAALEDVQVGGSSGTGRGNAGAAYTRSNPTRRADS